MTGPGVGLDLREPVLPDQVEKPLVAFHAVDELVEVGLEGLVILGGLGEDGKLRGIVVVVLVA